MEWRKKLSNNDTNNRAQCRNIIIIVIIINSVAFFVVVAAVILFFSNSKCFGSIYVELWTAFLFLRFYYNIIDAFGLFVHQAHSHEPSKCECVYECFVVDDGMAQVLTIVARAHHEHIHVHMDTHTSIWFIFDAYKITY